jgi:hypothetical protein
MVDTVECGGMGGAVRHQPQVEGLAGPQLQNDAVVHQVDVTVLNHLELHGDGR